MYNIELLRLIFNERFRAGPELFRAVEKTITEYQGNVSPSKEENDCVKRLLDIILLPEIQLHRADLHQTTVSKEEVPPEQQQEWSLSKPTQMKEEQEELRTSQEEEQLQELKYDTKDSVFFPCSVKSESDEYPTQSSHLRITQSKEYNVRDPSTEPIKTEPGEEDSSELASDCKPISAVNPACSAAPVENSEGIDCKESEGPLSALKTRKSKRMLTEKGQSSLISSKGRKSVEVSHLKSPDRSKSKDICHTEEKPHCCNDCGKCFAGRGVLKRHMRIHTGEKPFNCHHCNLRFNTIGNLKSHMRSHTGEKPYCCHDCGKAFTRSDCMTRHMRSHTGEKPYCCHDCGKSFTRRTHMTRHMRSHTGEKPYCCHDCGKAFTRRTHMTQHMRSHTGENPYYCHDCGKSFTRRTHMTQHMRSHTGEKPHCCQHCGKCFSQKGNLKSHMKSHTGDKPYPCHLCNKHFTERSTLKVHMRIHTGDKPFRCQDCNRCFTQKSNLNKHIMKLHMRSHRGGETTLLPQ